MDLGKTIRIMILFLYLYFWKKLDHDPWSFYPKTQINNIFHSNKLQTSLSPSKRYDQSKSIHYISAIVLQSFRAHHTIFTMFSRILMSTCNQYKSLYQMPLNQTPQLLETCQRRSKSHGKLAQNKNQGKKEVCQDVQVFLMTMVPWPRKILKINSWSELRRVLLFVLIHLHKCRNKLQGLNKVRYSWTPGK